MKYIIEKKIKAIRKEIHQWKRKDCDKVEGEVKAIYSSEFHLELQPCFFMDLQQNVGPVFAS